MGEKMGKKRQNCEKKTWEIVGTQEENRGKTIIIGKTRKNNINGEKQGKTGSAWGHSGVTHDHLRSPLCHPGSPKVTLGNPRGIWSHPRSPVGRTLVTQGKIP